MNAAGAVRELLLGRRGAAKVVHLCLPVAVLLSASRVADPRTALGAVAGALVAAACFAQVSILLNDLADRREDRDAGKLRWIVLLPLRGAVLLLGLVAALGAAALVAAGARGGALALYGASLALGAAYSLPPLRLKARGLAGPLAYSAAGAAAYALVPGALLAGPAAATGTLAAVVFLDKLVHLLHHQVTDMADDARSGTRTHAVAAGPLRARAVLRRAAWLATAGFLAVAVLLAASGPPWRAGAGGLAGAAALAAWALARRGPKAAAAEFARELPAPYLVASLAAVRLLPALLLAVAARQTPGLLALAAASAAIAAVELASYGRTSSGAGARAALSPGRGGGTPGV